jgi:Cd2+/Zn2+-exporting ATPase/Cu+-exporting ATPase
MWNMGNGVTRLKTLEVSIAGMDCAECTQHVRRSIAQLPGVESVEVLLSSEKAIVRLDPSQVSLSSIHRAVARAGDYWVPQGSVTTGAAPFGRRVFVLTAWVFGAVLLVVVLGEWLGLLARLTERVPFAIGAALVLASGWPVFRKVVRSALNRQLTSHSLMTLGALAALGVGEWATAAVVVFFMRVGDSIERFTAEGARRAVKDLTAMAPQRARVQRGGAEIEIPVGQVAAGEVVIVRPGEEIPVDGEVVDGRATVDQAAITGESMPAEVGPGSRVFAATIARLGALRVRATHVGPHSTFGRVVKLVEEAEAHRGEMQRLADRFTGYYLPIVVGIALLTFLITRSPLSTAAVLVVACSCAIALATPIAMLASIGAAARRGILIKGGKYLEALARADVLLIDKTGTLTLGRPQLTDVISLNGLPEDRLVMLAAAAERYSEHPLAEAVRAAAQERQLPSLEPESFAAIPGMGVKAEVQGETLLVGGLWAAPEARSLPSVAELQAQGKTLLCLILDGTLVGVLAAADTLRPEVPQALAELGELGLTRVELLTGDSPSASAGMAQRLGVPYRAGLLPQDKIEVVRRYQAEGHTVIMVGDGVNDAPALAQANVGVAMGAAGSDLAIEAAHVALMREDWLLVPALVRIARRTMRVVKGNLAFAALYNLTGLSLAALGLLPPVLAAAAQSLSDLAILANSSRLLRQR